MLDDEKIIQEIEAMPIEEVRAELVRRGIDSRPLVAYIKGLVKGIQLAGGLEAA